MKCTSNDHPVGTSAVGFGEGDSGVSWLTEFSVAWTLVSTEEILFVLPELHPLNTRQKNKPIKIMHKPLTSNRCLF